jgi:hypothetical protein
MGRDFKEPPEWYNDPDTLVRLLAIVIAALLIKFAIYLSGDTRDGRAIQQPTARLIRNSLIPPCARDAHVAVGEA